MSTHLSVAEIFRKLEERMKLHEERAAFHAQQEDHHREQSAFHTAELQRSNRVDAAIAPIQADIDYEPVAYGDIALAGLFEGRLKGLSVWKLGRTSPRTMRTITSRSTLMPSPRKCASQCRGVSMVCEFVSSRSVVSASCASPDG